MEKVLIIANQFPPMGGAGVQRTTKFVKNLPEYGFKPIVITKEHVSDLTDYTLLNDIANDTIIHRLKPYDLVNKNGIFKLPLKFIGTRLLSPDAEYFWYFFNRKKVAKIVESEKIQKIYTTSYPYSSHLLGLYLKEQFPDVYWVVDFRDEWTNNPYHLDSWFKSKKLKLEKKMEFKVTNNCDFLIANTPIMLRNFINDNPILKEKSTYISNGYDEDDFKGLSKQFNKNNKFVITHIGSLYGRRNLDDFLEAVKMSIEDKKINKEKIEIRIVGNVYKKDIDNYKLKYNLENNINFISYLPHRESIQQMYNTDVLLLLIGKGPGSENFYTGKIFEYIRVGNPILAIVPKVGVAAQVIKETNTGIIAEPGNVREISEKLNSLYNKWINSKLSIRSNLNEIKKYNRKIQAEKLAKILRRNYNCE